MDLESILQTRKRKKKVRWSPEEDKALLEFVGMNGT